VTVEQAPVNVQQTVTVQGQAAPPPTIIKIEPAQPQVVYVPTYNPTVVYGTWPYPASPPYSYYPPGYVATTSLISFGVGMAVGAALWGGCSWGGYGGHNDVNINVNNYNNFNHTNISNNNWQHNVDHRKGVQYRDPNTQQKYNRAGASDAKSREAFRGRAEQGRQELAGGAAKDFKGNAGAGADRGGRQPGANGPADRGGRQAAANRPTDRGGRQSAGERPGSKAQRPQAQGRAPSKSGAGAFQGLGDAQQVRGDANRGKASRQSAAAFGGGGGGSRQAGGGARGGGGQAGGGGGHGGGRRH